MNIPKNQPAHAYDLNLLLSALSRFREIKNPSVPQCKKVEALLNQLIEEVFSVEKPIIFHNDPKALESLGGQLERLLSWLHEDFVLSYVSQEVICQLREILKKLKIKAHQMKPRGKKRQQYFDPQNIAKLFGMPHMWSNAVPTLQKELERFPEPFNHPETPDVLKKSVSLRELRSLVQWTYTHLFKVRMKCKAALGLMDNDPQYHLFWTLFNNQVRFGVPKNFGLDILFSFEIPHTPAHLLHLEALQEQGDGESTYCDDMPRRVYFEAVAVLAEWKMIETLRDDPAAIYSLMRCLDNPDDFDRKQLRQWLLMDRIFEARLRAARLLADHCTREGLNYEETCAEIGNQLKITHKNIEREVQKYYSLTGLGAIYTLGYRRLLNAGVANVPEAIKGSQEKIILTWKDFQDVYEEEERSGGVL